MILFCAVYCLLLLHFKGTFFLFSIIDEREKKGILCLAFAGGRGQACSVGNDDFSRNNRKMANLQTTTMSKKSSFMWDLKCRLILQNSSKGKQMVNVRKKESYDMEGYVLHNLPTVPCEQA